MRIVFIGQKGIPCTIGGVERYVEVLSIGLAKIGYDVTVYGRKWYVHNDHNFYQGVKLITLPSLRSKNLDAATHTILCILHAAVFGHYDIIHINGVGPALFTSLAKILCPKAKIVTTFHCRDKFHSKWGRFARLMLSLGERAACREPDHTIAISDDLSTHCRNLSAKNLSRIHYGLAVPSKNNLLTAAELENKFGLKAGNYFVVVTRLLAHKNIHQIIEAYKMSGVSRPLAIVGSGSYSSAYVRELNLLTKNEPQIKFLGGQQGLTLYSVLAHAFCYITASSTEGTPFSLLEAAFYSLPVMVSRIPEHLEVVDSDGLRGWIFPLGSVVTLAQKIKAMDALDEMSRALMGQALRAFVENAYSQERLVAETLAVYVALKNFQGFAKLMPEQAFE